MEGDSCSERLYTPPRPYFTADFNKFFLLLRETLTQSLRYVLEDEAVFLYVESGHGRIVVNGQAFSLYPGCACLLQTYHVYSLFAADPDPLRLAVIVMDYPLQIYCNFKAPDPKAMEENYQLIPIVPFSAERQKEMRELLRKCEREDHALDKQGALIKTALYCQIRLLFQREAVRQSEKTQARVLPLGWSAWTYLTMFSGTRIEPAEIAEALDVPLSQLNRELRRISGYDCRKLLARARIQIAASMLLFQDLSMQYISTSVGFSSENSFYRNFKEWRGMTPQEYRNRLLAPDYRFPRQRIFEKPYVILNYVSNNYRREISLRTASQELFLSEATINQICIDYFHKPFYKMVTNWRMLHAQALLSCTDLPICDIAMDLGFNSVHTFSRLFKSRFHKAPGQFRKERSSEHAGI